MKSNKFNFAYALLTLAIFACEPMNEVYDELDKGTSAGVTTDITMVMTEDDYELALPIAENGNDSSSMSQFYNFSDGQARKYVPYILSEKFPQLANRSSVLVGYDLYQGSAEGVSDYTRADNYFISGDAMSVVSTAASEAGFFNDSNPAEEYIPSILGTNVQDPLDGQLMSVTYRYAAKEYDEIEFENVYSETFDEVIPETYEIFDLAGTADWYWRSFSGDGYAYISGFNNGANEDWIIAPGIDLTGVSGATLRIYQTVNFLGSFEYGTDLQVLISTDYAGDPAAATWTNADLSVWPDGDSYDFVDSKVDLSSLEDQTIHVAFKYTCTADDAALWQVSTLAVEVGEDVPTTTMNQFYQYDGGSGSWVAVEEGVYYLNSGDYDAMGAPGRFDNFSSSLPADDYIITYLTNTAPYAFGQEEDELVVVYKYFSSSAGAVQTRGNRYIVVDGVWTAYSSVVPTQLLFAKEEGNWVPDNTIKLSLGSPDYSWIVEAFAESNPGGSGNMDTFGNFSCFEWSEEQIFEAITGRLEVLYGTPEEGQKYQVTYSIYCGASSEPTLAVIYEGGEWAEQ